MSRFGRMKITFATTSSSCHEQLTLALRRSTCKHVLESLHIPADMDKQLSSSSSSSSSSASSSASSSRPISSSSVSNSTTDTIVSAVTAFQNLISSIRSRCVNSTSTTSSSEYPHMLFLHLRHDPNDSVREITWDYVNDVLLWITSHIPQHLMFLACAFTPSDMLSHLNSGSDCQECMTTNAPSSVTLQEKSTSSYLQSDVMKRKIADFFGRSLTPIQSYNLPMVATAK